MKVNYDYINYLIKGNIENPINCKNLQELDTGELSDFYITLLKFTDNIYHYPVLKAVPTQIKELMTKRSYEYVINQLTVDLNLVKHELMSRYLLSSL